MEEIERLLKGSLETIDGVDGDGTAYGDLKGLWTFFDKRQAEWYSKAFNFWEDEANCPITDDGVLGGYGKITPADVVGSNRFLDDLKALDPSFTFHKVADCGAGIGRVSKNLLAPRFAHVVLVEQSPRLLNSSTAYIGQTSATIELLQQGLQEFKPEKSSFDLIWIQWVIGHLTDLDAIDFFKRCVHGLRPGGFVVLKDNCTEAWTYQIDNSDSSVARHAAYIRVLISLADCEVVKESVQLGFPAELLPVRMFAIRAKR